MKIVRLAARGDGVDEQGGFHPGAVPGDDVHDDGTIVPGPHRTAPPCRHFGRCGSCQLQHADDGVLARFIEDRIVSALAAQGLPAPDMREAHLSPPGARRRASLKAVRAGGRILLGFSEAKSHRIVDLSHCPVMAPQLQALIAPLRDLFGQLTGRRGAGAARLTLADQGVDLALEGIEADGLEPAERLTGFAQTHRLARLSLDDGYGAQVRWEPEPVTVTFAGVPVALPDNSFLQATADGEASLAVAVRDIAAGTAHAVDLFAGIGTFSFTLPGKVHAVEGAREAVLALQAAANRAQRPVTSEHRDLFRRPLSRTELAQFEVAVLDPPRAGALEQARELAQSAIPAIAYVSCNPATFARDAKVLIAGGYALEWVRPVGQFRWSTHVELAACFRK